MVGFGYTPRVGKIYVVALTNSFAQVLTKAQAKAIRGFKVKTRFIPAESPPFFDIAFTSGPDDDVSSGSGFYSLGGTGSGDMAAPANGLWARARESSGVGKFLEIITYD